MSADISTERTIQRNATTVMDESASEMNATTNIMDRGSSKTTREGDKLEDLVNEKQEVYSAGAAPSIHETMDKVKNKLTNTVKDVFD